MDNIIFDWDKNKYQENQKKHKVSFDEAKTAFYDTNAVMIGDPDHSDDEERFILLGFSKKANLLVVCHCYRDSDTIIRIFSARKANTIESAQYYDFQ